MTPALFGGIGFLIDRKADTKPLFTVGLVLFAIVGMFVRMWYGYDDEMKAHEKNMVRTGPANASERSNTSTAANHGTVNRGRRPHHPPDGRHARYRPERALRCNRRSGERIGPLMSNASIPSMFGPQDGPPVERQIALDIVRRSLPFIPFRHSPGRDSVGRQGFRLGRICDCAGFWPTLCSSPLRSSPGRLVYPLPLLERQPCSATSFASA